MEALSEVNPLSEKKLFHPWRLSRAQSGRRQGFMTYRRRNAVFFRAIPAGGAIAEQFVP